MCNKIINRLELEKWKKKIQTNNLETGRLTKGRNRKTSKG